jgi:hypothetical protein
MCMHTKSQEQKKRIQQYNFRAREIIESTVNEASNYMMIMEIKLLHIRSMFVTLASTACSFTASFHNYKSSHGS